MTDNKFMTWVQTIILVVLIEMIHRIGLTVLKIKNLRERSIQAVVSAVRSEFNFHSLPRAAFGTLCFSTLVLGLCFITGKELQDGFLDREILTVCLLLSPLMWLSKTQEQNVAVGLAWSFYFGYLKLVLPELLANINYSKYRDELTEKVFVLIPTNCEVFDELRDRDDRLEFVENLEPVKKNIAGIKVRRYTHSVYKVNPNHGRSFLAILEYATPLRTLHAMSNHREAGLSHLERDRQVVLFYNELKDIINNHAESPEIKLRIELVLLTGKAGGREIADEIVKCMNQTKVYLDKQD